MKLSIITINLNHRDGLEKTLESVRVQTFRDFEQIVVDGGSTDGSLDVIHTSEAHIARWVSEPDAGIYNAMNKGLAMARGEYVYFLNSGDYLATPEVLDGVFRRDNSGVDILYGSFLRRNADHVLYETRAPERMTIFAYYRKMICHQAVFYKSELFSKFGLYDETFRYAADYEFTIRCLDAGAESRAVGFPVVVFEDKGASVVAWEKTSEECERIWGKYIGPSVREDYDRLAFLEAECIRLKKAEDWIEEAKRKPLWFNVGLMCVWRWDRLFKHAPARSSK